MDCKGQGKIFFENLTCRFFLFEKKLNFYLYLVYFYKVKYTNVFNP